MPPTRVRRSAAQRAAAFATAQADLTPEQLEAQKEENRTPPNSAIAHSYAFELKTAKRWFHEFMQDQHPDVDVDSKHFKLGAPAPDVVLLKEYARYLARSRTGLLTPKLKVKTVQHYLEMLIIAMKRDCHFSENTFHLGRECHNFIGTVLKEKEGLSTVAHVKGVAHSEDLTYVLSKLFTPEYLATFGTMRQVLNLTLYMLLLVDCTERGCGIARHPKRPEHMCLRWGDIEFYTFSIQGEGGSSMDIRANVRIRWGKNQSQDDSRGKTVPFTALLPTSMAIEDTLRLLLTLALLDGVLDHGIKTWDDLYKLRVSKDEARTGRRIAIKPSMRQAPVLRRMNGKHRLTMDPVQTVDIHPQIRRLGRFCGFEHRFVGYCLRRGAAYILATQTTVENRMFLMGHSSPGEYDPYHSNISTIDFCRMFRALGSLQVRQQSGISLNLSSTAPQRISDAGYQSVLEHEDVVAQTRQQQELRDRILENHPSLFAASRTNEPLWYEYKQVSTDRKVTIDSMVNQVYKEEYAWHFENLSARPEPSRELVETGTDNGLDGVQAHLGDTQDMASPNPSGTVDAIGDGMSEGSGQSSVERSEAAAEEDFMSLIDPRLMSEAQADQDEMLRDITEDETPSETPQDQQAASATKDAVQNDNSTTRLHGLPDKFIGRGINRVLAPRRGLSAYHDLRVELTSLQGNEAAMFRSLARWFSVTHGIDDFPPGEEPEPGTFNCCFCGLDLATVHKAHEHTHPCALKDAQQRAKDLRENTSPLDRPCDFQCCGTGDEAQQFVKCGKTFSTYEDMGKHMRYHVLNMAKKDADGEKVPTCFFGDCAANPEGGRGARDGPDFTSPEERLWHAWTNHQIWTIKSVETTYYEYCGTWLLAPYEWQVHADMHMEDAVQIVRDCGYAGYTTGRTTVPRICPFHFHDETAPTHERIFTYTREGLMKHVRGHLEKQSGLQNCPCFPRMCAEARKLDGVQMEEHLRVVHGVHTEYKVKKRRAPLKDISNANGSNSGASKKAKA